MCVEECVGVWGDDMGGEINPESDSSVQRLFGVIW